MDPTIVVLLIAAGGAIAAGAAVLGVFALADIVRTRLARRRDANGVQPNGASAQTSVYSDRSEGARRSGRKLKKLDSVRVQQLIVEIHRTRSILLGWLSVLEAFALGDAWRATALRAELGDLNTCDISLVGDANLIATYQMTVDVLRNQAGRGLPPDIASEMASIRVRLLTALAEQERRLNLGEWPVIAQPLVHFDLWGPPRPITEVMIRPPVPESPLLPPEASTSSRALSEPPPAESPPVVRPVTVGLPPMLDAPSEAAPSSSVAWVNPPSPARASAPAESTSAAGEPQIARSVSPRTRGSRPKTEQGTQPTTRSPRPKAPAPQPASRAAAADRPLPPAKATRSASKSIATTSTKSAPVVEAAPAKPARVTRAAPIPTPTPTSTPKLARTLAPHLVPTAVPARPAVRSVAKPVPLAAPSTAPVAVSRPTQVPAGRPAQIGAGKSTSPGPRPAARATLGPMSQSAASPGGKAQARPTSKRSAP